MYTIDYCKRAVSVFANMLRSRHRDYFQKKNEKC